MKRDFLKDLGLEDDTIKQIMAEHGKSVNSIKEQADKVEGLESQIEDYSQQIKDRDTQLEELNEKAQGNEELQQQIQDLQQQNETAQQEWQQKLDSQAFDHALDKSLSGAKAKNPKAVRALLDTESIKLDGDKLLGFDDQLDGLRESDPYLFDDDGGDGDPKPSFTTGQHTKGGTQDSFAQTLLGKG